jgi:hypothetical protein
MVVDYPMDVLDRDVEEQKFGKSRIHEIPKSRKTDRTDCHPLIHKQGGRNRKKSKSKSKLKRNVAQLRRSKVAG